MKDRRIYQLRPLQSGVSTEFPTLHEHYGNAVWNSENWRVKQKSIQKRPGYLEDRDLGSGIEIQRICKYDKIDATSFTLLLTDKNLIKRETATDKTWSYQTEMGDYDSTIDDITGAVVTGKAGTTWQTDAIAAGDCFILDDDHTADEEPDTHWGVVQTIDSETQITLTATYTGTTGSFTGSEKDALIRKVYSTPGNERWSWATVDDKFCFTNGNSDVHYWDNTGYATALDSTNAKKARYCIEYAERLVLADLEVSGSRDPLTVQWSKNGDPTDWTDQTAGSAALLQSSDFITGLGKTGGNLVVYRSDSITFGTRSGRPNAPILFPSTTPGVGMSAPWSLVDVKGTNAWVWRDNFYILNGTQPVSIGDTIRDRFFDIVNEQELLRVFGWNDVLRREVWWRANTSLGVYHFVWNYASNEWYVYNPAHNIFSAGQGAI